MGFRMAVPTAWHSSTGQGQSSSSSRTRGHSPRSVARRTEWRRSTLLQARPAPSRSASRCSAMVRTSGADQAPIRSGPATTTTFPHRRLHRRGWSVVLYNGNGGVTYGTLALSGTIADQCGGRGTVVVAAPGLQDGAPDGLALVNGTAVVEFLSYEGAFAATNGPANGMSSTDIGVAESGEASGNSLQKDAAGWYGPTTSSFGACNVRPASKISFTGRFPGDVPLPVGFE